jgi:hypothetical protein
MPFIEGVDNSACLIFVIIFGSILYLFSKVLNFLTERRPISSSPTITNANNNPNANSNPYNNVQEDEECSICSERMKYKIELDCQHNFCGKCIMDYYQTLRPNALKCPLCRSNVRLINSDNMTRNADTREFYDEIVKFNHRNLNGYNFYSAYFFDFPYLLSRGIGTIFSSIGSIILFFIFSIIVIYYFFNPYDIIPDTLGVLGYTDDFSFLAALLIWIVERYFSAFRNRVQQDYEQILSE